MIEFPFDVDRLIQICREAGVDKIGIFGSMARWDWNADSDIDVLVRFPDDIHIGLLGMVHLKNELTEALGRNVDLGTERQLDPYLRDEILHELVTVFEE